MTRALVICALLISASAKADDKPFTNIFCQSTEIRSELYRIYDEQREQFTNALAATLDGGQCVWKDYGDETELKVLYRFNETQVMVSAEFDETTWYAVTFNEYVE